MMFANTADHSKKVDQVVGSVLQMFKSAGPLVTADVMTELMN
jgi:hypothetical protein